LPSSPDRVFRSPIRYAICRDGVHIAYQVVGDGPIDVLCVPGFVCHLDLWWDAPTDELVRRLASFSRLILFDKRGMGLSDRPEKIDAEDWVEDACAVLDAVGSERAVILGISAGGCTAALLAAGHPERIRALVIFGGYARMLRGDDYELGYDRDTIESFISGTEANWGTTFGLELYAPSRASDPMAQAYIVRYATIAASPRAGATFLRALAEIDIRYALPTITAPTLILHAARDQNVPIEAARYSRDLIPGAELVELDSDIHLLWLSDVVDEIGQEIEKFVAQTDPATTAAIDAALAGTHRSDRNKARDRYRHPKETLTFFGLRRDMTVVEIWPGGGWYTEVLAPVLKGKGKLYAAQYGASSPFDLPYIFWR